MHAFRSLMTVLVVGTLALSGCTMPFQSGDVGGTFARSVAFSLDAASFAALETGDQQALMAEAVATSFTYTQQDRSLDVADIGVRYVDARGTEVTKALSTFTDASTLQRGDSITVDDVHLTSGIAFVSGDQTVASRTGQRADWLTADGAPLPIALAPDDATRWDFEASLTADASATAVDVQGAQIRNILVDVDSDVAGSLGFTASGTPAAMDVVMDLEGDGRLAALAQAQMPREASDGQEGGTSEGSDGTYLDMGMDLDAEGEGDMRLALEFEDRVLRSGTANGALFADGTWYMWDEHNSRADRQEPPFVAHPFIDETFTDVPLTVGSASDVLETTVAFLEDLYAMDLVVGDVFTFELDLDMFIARLESSYEVQVVAAEERTVPAGTFDTFRVEATQETLLGLGGERHRLPLTEATVWVMQDSYLPVAAEGSMGFDLDAGPLTGALTALSGPDLDLGDASFSMHAASTMELTQHDGAPRVAGALLGAGNIMVFPLMTSFAGMGMPRAAEPLEEPSMHTPPQMEFRIDEQTDAITIVDATRHAFWDDLLFEVEVPSHAARNRAATSEDPQASPSVVFAGPVNEGDFVAFCAPDAVQDVPVRIVHIPTNTVVYAGTFASWAPCAQ